MKPSARLQAAIDILGDVLNGAAADRALQAWGRAHRFAGSGDRRAIAAHVYAALRHAPGHGTGRATMIAGLAASGVALETIDALFDGAQHAPAPLTTDERDLASAPRAPAPDWLRTSMGRAFGESADAELLALSTRAALDLRVNTLKTTRDAAADRLAEDGVVAQALPEPDTALTVLSGNDRLESSAAYTQGLVEVQDAGSQITAAMIEASPGMAVLDLCAGAGGKTIAAAAQMRNQGRIVAADIADIRLKRLMPRAERAGATIIETRLLPNDWLDHAPSFAERFDRVVLDAPCSGSGTWRRNPETRLRLTPDAVAAHAAQQTRLLDAAAPLVAPGGRLVLITCSVLAEEGEDHIAPFLARHPGFRLHGAPRRLGPASTGTDGFFAVVFEYAGEPPPESGSGA